MSASLAAGCLWVVLASVVAMFPMRHQMVPGMMLLVAAPILLVWIGLELGLIAAALGTLGFLSMFRRPLAHALRKITGTAARGPRGGAA